MIINMNGKDYELAFGFDFLDYLNKNNSLTMDVNGQSMSSGLGGATMLASTLGSRMPSTLMTTIKAGTAHLSQKPSNKDIESYINGIADDDEAYELVFLEIEEELKKQPATRREMGLSK